MLALSLHAAAVCGLMATAYSTLVFILALLPVVSLVRVLAMMIYFNLGLSFTPKLPHSFVRILLLSSIPFC